MKTYLLIIFFVLVAAPLCFGNESGYAKVVGMAYFDTATGHQYKQQDPDTYAEYSRNGKFLKYVPANLPLLTKSRNVHPITDNTYILYENYLAGEKKYLTLPGSESPPEGWKACKMMIPLK